MCKGVHHGVFTMGMNQMLNNRRIVQMTVKSPPDGLSHSHEDEVFEEILMT